METPPKPRSIVGFIKGSALVPAVSKLRKEKERARAFLPKHLHKYLEGRILISTWYPEEDSLELIRAVAKILEQDGVGTTAQVYAFMGRELARHNLRIYDRLIAAGDPAGTLRRSLAIWSIYHDTGSSKVTIDAPGKARLELKDYALPSQEMCLTRVGYYAEILRHAGASDVRIVELQCSARGAPTCVMQIEWKDKPKAVR
jgi:hypothetical protein